MTTPMTSAPLRVPPANPEEAAAYFAARLSFHTDVADVHDAVESGTPGFALIDSRGAAAWAQGRIPAAIHLPTAEIPQRAPLVLDPAVMLVTYCWGPGCDGAARAALVLSRLGWQVKEMLGGIEYWLREGFPVETDSGLARRAPDLLTTASSMVTCDC
jgi:rhodanese-related sulfurtransferase